MSNPYNKVKEELSLYFKNLNTYKLVAKSLKEQTDFISQIEQENNLLLSFQLEFHDIFRMLNSKEYINL